MSKLRVLHVLEASGFGTGRHVADLVHHISEVDHAVAVPRERRADKGVAPSPLEGLAGAGALTLHYLPMDRFPLHPGNARALWHLRRVIRDWRPDVLHGHSSVGGAIARFAAMAKLPVVYTPNGLHPSGMAMRLERRLASRTSVVIAVSDSEAQEIISRQVATPSQVRVIVNGVEPDVGTDGHAGLRSLAGIDADSFLVAFVGRLAEQKDPITLIDALGLLAARGDFHDSIALLVGSGPLAASVHQAIVDRGLADQVRQLEHVADLGCRLSDVDVLVSTSRWEGGPYVPLEAMRAGVPIVLSRCTGNRDLVEDGSVGLAFDVGDAEQLAACISALRTDPMLRQALAANGKRRVHERFSIHRQAAKTSELYADLVHAG